MNYIATPSNIANSTEAQLRTQQPYDNAKFYTAMRHRLHHYDLPASALAVFVGLHMIIHDADTGRFFRDDVTLRKTLNLPKSTVHQAFERLTKTSLIRELEDGEWMITHYEQDRLMAKSYFRLNENFIEILPLLVQHHAPNVLLFGLELLDRGRHYNSEIIYGTKTLIHEWNLGNCRSRVYKALALLSRIALWTIVPNKKETDDNLHFHLNKDYQRDEEQNQYRALHGRISRETKEAYNFSGGTDKLTWYELAKTTRMIIQYGIEHQLEDKEMIRLAGIFGSYCARERVKTRKAYLGKALKSKTGNLYEKVQWLAS
ncbi:hypothetical protein [Alicyclobacillus fodiniaquatilis]|uniref:Replication initiation protein n=1 Tax=Alicyclobacillus fodiniaquatilis TaxID=1661150 RepID=A0ABW4JP73_9BACL